MKNGTGESPGGISGQILHPVRGEFYDSIAEVLRTARSKAYRAVNFVMVEAYWNIGRMIVEEEQQGRERAGYGEALVRGLSKRLNEDFGRASESPTCSRSDSSILRFQYSAHCAEYWRATARLQRICRQCITRCVTN